MGPVGAGHHPGRVHIGAEGHGAGPEQHVAVIHPLFGQGAVDLIGKEGIRDGIQDNKDIGLAVAHPGVQPTQQLIHGGRIIAAEDRCRLGIGMGRNIARRLGLLGNSHAAGKRRLVDGKVVQPPVTGLRICQGIGPA